MRVAALTIASCLLAVSGAGAFAQYVDPLRVLESSRRDRLEMDKRLAREAAARRQKEKAEQAAQANAQRKLEKEKAAAASGAPTPGAARPGLKPRQRVRSVREQALQQPQRPALRAERLT